jgi:nicotinamidase-related amidase
MNEALRPGRLLERARSLLLVIDLQEGYRGKLANEERTVTAAGRLLAAAGILGIPVIVSEQYPKGLGATRKELAPHVPPDAARFEKTSFSCLGSPALRDHLEGLGRSQIVVAGIETHVCVGQTVGELLALGYQPHLARDAISARFPLEDEAGFTKMVGSGAVPASSESLLFEWLRTASAPEFKAIHKLVV